MSKPFDYLVFFGRFQPLHNGHVQIIERALKESEKVIIMIGSANISRNPKNPFTASEREDMIRQTFKAVASRIIVRHIDDFPHNDQKWIAAAHRIVTEAVLQDINPKSGVLLHGTKDKKIGLIGFAKDHTSFYQKLFPEWGKVDVPTQFSTLNSTEIRREYLKPYYRLPDRSHCPQAVIAWLDENVKTEPFRWLVRYQYHNETYDPKQYDVNVACVDAVVIQAGHILLVERKDHPGMGQLALPGGHVNTDERYKDAVIRELREETKISDEKGELPPAMLASFIKDKEFFDDPNRSLRARVTTMAYLFELPSRTKLYSVKGSDDAASAGWYKIGELEPTMFFEDHWFIIQTMLDKRVKES